MVFSSLSFLYCFLPLVVLAYYVWKNRVYRNVLLLLASLFFYAWGEPKLIVVMVLSAFCAYVGGLLIERHKTASKPQGARIAMIATVVILVGTLFVFKYLNLFVDTVNAVQPGLLTLRRIALPIGISFYTFQILSYVVDLYRGKVNLQRNFFYLLLYVSFFPQLIAGPIVRYETVELEIRERKENWQDFVAGLERFIFGLGKKVLLANSLAKIADGIYGTGAEAAGTLACWLAIVAYAFQIYFDFSGYSDMAIGIGRMFGYHFLENFDYPYTSCSVTEFWRRWHISLSSWFRDYVYIPLGGNRVSKSRHIFNLMVVWALTGFWHGAQWNFLLWGLYYGLLLMAEKYLLGKFLKKLPKVLQWLYSFVLVCVGWVIFYHESVPEILSVLKTMFWYTPGSLWEVLVKNTQMIPMMYLLPVGAVCVFPVFRRFTSSENVFVSILREGVCGVILVLSIVFLLSSSYNPFIYFRF